MEDNSNNSINNLRDVNDDLKIVNNTPSNASSHEMEPINDLLEDDTLYTEVEIALKNSRTPVKELRRILESIKTKATKSKTRDNMKTVQIEEDQEIEELKEKKNKKKEIQKEISKADEPETTKHDEVFQKVINSFKNNPKLADTWDTIAPQLTAVSDKVKKCDSIVLEKKIYDLWNTSLSKIFKVKDYVQMESLLTDTVISLSGNIKQKQLRKLTLGEYDIARSKYIGIHQHIVSAFTVLSKKEDLELDKRAPILENIGAIILEIRNQINQKVLKIVTDANFDESRCKLEDQPEIIKTRVKLVLNSSLNGIVSLRNFLRKRGNYNLINSLKRLLMIS